MDLEMGFAAFACVLFIASCEACVRIYGIYPKRIPKSSPRFPPPGMQVHEAKSKLGRA